MSPTYEPRRREHVARLAALAIRMGFEVAEVSTEKGVVLADGTLFGSPDPDAQVEQRFDYDFSDQRFVTGELVRLEEPGGGSEPDDA